MDIPGTRRAMLGDVPAPVPANFNFDDDDTIVTDRATLDREPPPLPFPLRRQRPDSEWLSSLPEAARAVLVEVADRPVTEWDGGSRIAGAIAQPL